jgi:hypothetical protein
METEGNTTVSDPIVSVFRFHHHTRNSSMMNHLVMKMKIMLKECLRGVEMVGIIIGEGIPDLGVVEVKASEGMVVNKTNTR